MKRVLVTGFEPFGASTRNPTQEIVARLRDLPLTGVDLKTDVLPVEFERASFRIRQLIDELSPEVVIALGQAEGRSAVTPERVAVNIDDARIPDNAGFAPSEVPIIEAGPAAYFSTLPVRRIVGAVSVEGIPCAMSWSAGNYVCNRVFYVIQHHCEPRDIKSGFIHVPLMTEQADEFPGLPTLPLDDMVRAAVISIRTCAG